MGNLLYTDEYLKGKKFHALSYISFSHRDSAHAAFCKWKCECGKIAVIRASDVVTGKQKSCNCYRKRYGSSSIRWMGFGEISGLFWQRVTNNAKSRNLKVNITMEDGWNQYIKQNRKCALTGDPISFSPNKTLSNGTVSLDRIDNSKGYIRNNIQWVHKDINLMKRNWPYKKFLIWCKKVVKHS